MNRFLLVLSTAISLAAVAVCLRATASSATASSSATQGDGAAPTATAVGYMDLEWIFDRSEKKLEVESTLTALIDQTRVELKTLEAELEELNTKTSILKKGSAEYEKLMEEVYKKNARFQSKQASAEEEVATRWTTFREAHIEEIRGAAKTVAESRGLDLLLTKKLPRQEGVPDWDVVFHAAPGLDVSEAILATLNGSK